MNRYLPPSHSANLNSASVSQLEDEQVRQRMAVEGPGLSYDSALVEFRQNQINSDINTKAKSLNMGPMDLAYIEWEKATKDASSPFYGQDPQTFAQSVKALGSNRYDLLDSNKAVRGLMQLGNFFDNEFRSTGISQFAGEAAYETVLPFTQDAATLAAVESMGQEMPASLANMIPLAMGTVLTGGGALVGAAAMTGLDAFTDAREGGRDGSSAAGAGALAALSVGVMPSTGRFIEKFGADTALKIAGTNASAAAASLRTGVLNTAFKTAVREVGQVGVGTGFDIADIALFDDQRTLADLTKAEYLVPMLLSNGMMVLGQEVMTAGSNALRNRMTATPPMLPGVKAHLADKERLETERLSAERVYNAETVFNRQADIKSHGAYENMYDDMLRAHYYSDSDTHTAAAHHVAASFDAEKLSPWSLQPSQKTGDFLVRMSKVAQELNTPLSRLSKVSVSAFEAFKNTGASDSAAALRALNVMEDQASRLYQAIPAELKSDAHASKVWKIHEKQIKQGTAQLVYTDKVNGVTAVALNAFAGSAQPQVAVYKNGARVTEAEGANIMAAHGDGITAGLRQYQDVTRDLYQSTLQTGGVRVGKDVDPRMHQTVTDLMKGLGVDIPIMLIGDTDLNSPEFAGVKAHFGGKKYGSMLEFGYDKQRVAIVWTKSGQGKHGVATMMHELGHVVERHFSRKNPGAVDSLRQAAATAFSKIDMRSMENLRKMGPNHPEFLIGMKKLSKGTNIKYDFPEWFANQFSKWVVDPAAKPANVVEKYIAETVNALRVLWSKMQEMVGKRVKKPMDASKPDPMFNQWMNNMSRKFYMNLMWDNDAVFRGLSETYQMGDRATDMLGQVLYEKNSPDFHTLVSKRLAEWHMQGRGQDARMVISQALDDYTSMEEIAGLMPSEPEQATAGQVASMMFDPAKLGITQKTITRVLDKFHNMNSAGDFVDSYQVGTIVRTLTQRWVNGELPTQKGRPKFGGEELLWQKLNRSLDTLTKPVPQPLTLKASGDVDNLGGPVRTFTKEEADTVVKGMLSLAKYEMYQIEPQVLKDGKYKVVFKYAPDARKVAFDEEYHNAEMDNDVWAVIDNMKFSEMEGPKPKWTAEELAMELSATDQKYADALRNKDKSLATDLVREAAELAGYKTPAFHGTPKGGFTSFKLSKGFGSLYFFAKDAKYAEYYATRFRDAPAPEVMNVALKMENPLRVATFEPEGVMTAANLRKQGYDSVETPNAFIVFLPEQIKSLDAVVTDQKGQVIPLENRFKPTADIRGKVKGDGGIEFRSFDMAFTNFASSLPEDIAIDLGNLGLYTPNEWAARMGKAVAKAVGTRTAPEPLLRALDEVKKVSETDVGFHADLRSIGNDLGYKGSTLDGLVETLVNKLTKGESLRDYAMLAPAPFDRLIRAVGDTVDQYGRVSEYGARLGSVLGIHEQSLEQLKNGRAAGLDLQTAEQATQTLADLVQFSSEGGATARLTKLSREASGLRKLYDATINSFTQIAANNPVIAPFDEAIHMESRDQFRMMNDTMIPLHADDPNTLTHVDKAGATFTAIRGDQKLNQALDELIRLENFKKDSFENLLNNKDPQALELLQSLEQTKLPLLEDMRKRMRLVQQHNVQLRAVETRQLDRINLATFLSRQVPTMPPKQAQAFVDTMYQTDVKNLPAVLAESGLDTKLASRLIEYKNVMDESTTAMIGKLEQAPWYVSEQRMKRFLVRYFDPKLKRTGANDFDSREEAAAWMKENKARLQVSSSGIEDQQTKYGTRMTGDFREVLDSTIKAKQSIISSMFEGDENLTKQLNAVLDDVFQGVDSAAVAATKGTLNINRKFSEGRQDLDMIDQQRESIRRATVGLTRARTNALFSLYGQDQFFQTPEGSRLNRLAQQHLENFRAPDTDFGSALNKFSFSMTLAGNLSSMMTEVATVPLVLAPLLREKGAGFIESFALTKKVATEITKAFGFNDGVFANAEWNKVIDRAKRENALTARHLVDIDSSKVMNDLDSNRVIEGSKITKPIYSVAEWMYKIGAKMYQPAASASGMTTILTGFEMAKKSNPKGTFDQWYMEALNLHTRAQGAGGKAARPVGFFATKGAARTLSQVAYNLQSFSNMQVANLVHFAKKGWMDDPQWTTSERKQARAAFKQAMVTTLGTVGIAGIPLAKALSIVIEKTFGTNPEKELEQFIYNHAPGDEAEKSFITNFAMRGSAYASGLPFDLQSRMTVGGLFALNNYDGFNASNAFGVPGNFALEALQAMGGIARGDFSETLDMAPAGLKRAAQLWANEGKIVRNGEVLMEPNAIESAFMAMGFTPLELKKGYDMQTAKEYFEKQQTRETKQAVEKATDMLQAGKGQEARAYIEEQSAKLAGVREPQQVRQNMLGATAQRFASLNTPKARNPGLTSHAPALQSIYGGGDQASQVQLYLREQQAKLLMGEAPGFSSRRYQQAAQADGLMAFDANLSPVLAQTYARLYNQNVLPNPLMEVGM